MAPLRISIGLSAHYSPCAYHLTCLQTTSGADGRLIVWDVSEGEAKEVKLIEGVIPAVANTEYVSNPASDTPPSVDTELGLKSLSTTALQCGTLLVNTSSPQRAHMAGIPAFYTSVSH